MAHESRHEPFLIDEGAPATGAPRPSWTLPSDLLAESVVRLRVLALLYAFVFFMADFLPWLLFAEIRVLAPAVHWVPGALSIVVALCVAGLTKVRGLPDRAKLLAGLVFQVLGSVGIAAAESHNITAPMRYGDSGDGGFGLSWVAPWVMLFTIVVPTRPRTAAVAALASLSAVPLAFVVGPAVGWNAVSMQPGPFFFALVFPNLLVFVMAGVGARVLYRLGTAVREARELGSYRLAERLGQGGMGEVWRAEHRMLARPAAIKLMRPALFGARDAESRDLLVKRFEREAQATALLRSPHTIELYDFGVADDGSFFYVMELLDGFDLDDMVSRFGPLEAPRVIHLLAQACESLAEAHEAGLIHRDVKPANVYACRYARAVDFVKLLDFGLVTHGGAARDDTRLTAAHGAGGTPAFMSPEQALADERLDARSDIYSLGCVAYWLLTGSPVFGGRSPVETIVMHVKNEPGPPSRRAELPVPPELDAVILSCLAKDPARRPQTADALRARLEAVPGAGAWTADRARRWWDAHRPPAAIPPSP